MIFKNYYFLINSNSWPFFSSLSALNFMISLTLFFKFSEVNILILNLIFLLIYMIYWWNFFSLEMNLKGVNSQMMNNSMKFSFILFILSEVMFFFTFFWSYFHFFLSPSVESGLKITSSILIMADLTKIPFSATLILIFSSVTVTLSHYYLNKEKLKETIIFLITTFILGIMFSFFQMLEYKESFFSISDGFLGSIFFLLTGFHGIHVLIGSSYLILVSLKVMKMLLNKNNFLMFEMCCWYWHFVDLIWLIVFYSFYYLNF